MNDYLDTKPCFRTPDLEFIRTTHLLEFTPNSSLLALEFTLGGAYLLFCRGLGEVDSTLVENVRQIFLFMQNEPNFPPFSPKNEDYTKKRTQYEPKQTLFLLKNEGVEPNSNPIYPGPVPKVRSRRNKTNFFAKFATLKGGQKATISLISTSLFGRIIATGLYNCRRWRMLNPWFETAGVICIALLGVVLGWFFSRLKKSWWLLGYFLPFSLILLMLILRYHDSLQFVEPFSWLVAGRSKFVVLSFAVTMGLTVPLSRLPRKIEKILVCFLMVGVVFWFSVLPFLIPAVMKNYLSNIQTRLSYNGVCYQSTNYTCGPAAAVTALGKLGLSAEEGELAVLSYTSPVVGTLPVCLSSALQNRYGAEGLKCEYRHFDSIDQLKKAGITLAMVRDSFLLDHCIAVLEVSDNIVKIADPMTGLIFMPHEKFKKIWRFSGIVLQRDRSQNI